MQNEKSQPSGQRTVPETRLTSFPALSVRPRIGISLSASETNDRFYLCEASDDTDHTDHPQKSQVAI